MSLLLGSLRNLFRSPLRSILMVVLLAVSIGLALIMATVHAATQSQLGDIGGLIGTEINIQAAGSFGGMGGGEPLAADGVDQLSEIEHVASVQKSVQTSYTGDSLESAVDAGTIGTPPANRPGSGSSSGSTPPSFGGGQRPALGIQVMGASAAAESPTLMGASSFEIVQGTYITSDNADEMVIGQGLADANSLSVGSVVDMEGTELTVVGIYDSGTVFANNMVVMPIQTAERVFELDGVTSVTVVADDVENVDAVVEGIRQIFDEETADVTTAQDTYQRIGGSVENTASASNTGMIVSFVVAGVVVLFSVALMIRQRVKEIGIMKAIGASNWRIGLQFSVETMAVSIAGAVIGAAITYPLAQWVADLMTGNSSSGAGGAGLVGGGPPGGMFEQVGGRIAGLDVAVSPTVFLWALGVAALLAVLASVLPAWYIARVRPAEVLRNE